MAAVLWIGADWIAAAFLPGEEGRAAAVDYWRIASLTIGGYGITIAASAGFNGLGRPAHGMAITAGRALGLMIPLVLIGSFVFNTPQGVILGIAAANILAGSLTAVFVFTRAKMTAKHGKARQRKTPVVEETPVVEDPA